MKWWLKSVLNRAAGRGYYGDGYGWCDRLRCRLTPWKQGGDF